MDRIYKFIGIDEGRKKLFLRTTEEKSCQWSLSLWRYPKARSLQKVSDSRILVGYDRGYIELDIGDGSLMHRCNRWRRVSSVTRLDDGRTLLTGLNLEGMKGISVLTLDKQDRVVKKISCPGDYVRLMSITGKDTYLLSTNDSISETDDDLKLKGRLKTEGFLHAWQSLRMENGRTLASAGYGAFMALFSESGELIKRFGTKDDIPEAAPFFYACFQVTSDGNLLVANWQGHGPFNGKKGRQLLCFSSEGDYLKGWSFPKEISSLQGLLLIDEK